MYVLWQSRSLKRRKLKKEEEDGKEEESKRFLPDQKNERNHILYQSTKQKHLFQLVEINSYKKCLKVIRTAIPLTCSKMNETVFFMRSYWKRIKRGRPAAICPQHFFFNNNNSNSKNNGE